MSKVQWVGAVREFRTPACPPGYKLDPRRDKCVPVHQKLGEPTHPIIASAERAVALAGGPKIVRTLGAVETGENNAWRITLSLLSMAGAGLAAYHGYKRNHESTGSAIGWGVLGALFPVITVPVALAQGYGKPKGASENPGKPAVVLPEGAELYVRRDWTTEGNGRWRLSWSVPGSDTFSNDESSVTGRPFFRTMRDAVEHGELRYGIRAKKADW